MRLSVIVGDQGWYWRGWTEGPFAHQVWGRWGSKGREWTEACASPAAAKSKLDEWERERRQLGYEDDPNEDEEVWDRIDLGAQMPLPESAFEVVEPEVVRVLRQRRSVRCFALNPSGTHVLIALASEIREVSTNDGATRVIVANPIRHIRAITYLGESHFAAASQQQIWLYDREGAAICEVNHGAEQIVPVRDGKILITLTQAASIQVVKAYGILGSPRSLIEIGELELNWSRPRLHLHNGEAFVEGHLIRHLDEAYAYACDPPPRDPPGLTLRG